jgi:hypothetical protein
LANGNGKRIEPEKIIIKQIKNLAKKKRRKPG